MNISTGFTTSSAMKEHAIDVVEKGQRERPGRCGISLMQEISFSTSALESFLVAPWEPIIDDAVVVAAAIEYADRTVRRSAYDWARAFVLRIPVFETARWAKSDVHDALEDAIGFLTGDFWRFEFVQRKERDECPKDPCLDLSGQTESVIAYSDGMDSRAVAGLLNSQSKEGVVLVRLGGNTGYKTAKQRVPFTGIPYRIHMNGRAIETSARSRGFKFALVSGIAAYLSKASHIIIPESGQGALGPVLVPVGHAYPDYRNHPRFTARMQRFLNVLFDISVSFRFPRLWHTKGETLAAFIKYNPEADWQGTRSCWMDNRRCSIAGHRRQCGICAACLLRRMSVHAAGLAESEDTYVWNRIEAEDFWDAADMAFSRRDASYREYALAGTLHLDHLAGLATDDGPSTIRRQAVQLASAYDISSVEAEAKMLSLIDRHAAEWGAFMRHLGPRSFLNRWAQIQP